MRASAPKPLASDREKNSFEMWHDTERGKGNFCSTDPYPMIAAWRACAAQEKRRINDIAARLMTSDRADGELGILSELLNVAYPEDAPSPEDLYGDPEDHDASEPLLTKKEYDSLQQKLEHDYQQHQLFSTLLVLMNRRREVAGRVQLDLLEHYPMNYIRYIRTLSWWWLKSRLVWFIGRRRYVKVNFWYDNRGSCCEARLYYKDPTGTTYAYKSIDYPFGEE